MLPCLNRNTLERGTTVTLSLRSLLVAAILTACGCQQPVCPPAPESSVKTDESELNKVALNLHKLQIDGNTEQNFKKLSETAFATLSDKDAALLIFLRGLTCLIREANTPEKAKLVEMIIPSLTSSLHAMWAES